MYCPAIYPNVPRFRFIIHPLAKQSGSYNMILPKCSGKISTKIIIGISKEGSPPPPPPVSGVDIKDRGGRVEKKCFF